MLRKAAFVIAAAVAGTVASAATISTDRFGYSGTVTKYATLADARNGVNPTGTIAVGNRDLSIYVVSGQYNIVMGSWWYTTAENTNGRPKGDPQGDLYNSGWGNTTGNTGVGFVQLYEGAAQTVTSQSMSFGDFASGYWTSFTINESGANATYASSYARFSPFTSNVDDTGIYHDYALSLTATGLQGTETSPGVIEAFDHPTGVTGTYSGLFENTSSDPAKVGFYTFNFSLNMTNWAFDNRASLNGAFADSYFAVVPLPAALAMGLALLGGAGSVQFLRRRASRTC